MRTGDSPAPSNAAADVLLDDVIRTDDLARRPLRAPDYAAENRAFVTLARVMAASPHSVLQTVAEIAMELCDAGSAGISLAECENGNDIFRWHATAGEFSPLLGQVLPRAFSPCGAVLARNATVLMDEPVRYYPYIASLGTPITELLLVPFHSGQEAVGTLWVVSHNQKRFDSEHARLMTSLADFASVATQALQAHRVTAAALQDVRTKGEELAERRELAHAETLQRERVQSDLFTAQVRLDGILAAAEVGTWSLDFKTGQNTADRNFAALFGLSEEESRTTGMGPYLERMHPDDRTVISDAIARSRATGAPYSTVNRILLPNGGTRWVANRGCVRYNGDGEAAALYGVSLDITEQRCAEALVDGQKHALELALDGASLPTVLEILTHTIEAHSTDAIASILLLDPDGIHLRHGAGPRLPEAYN
ncbi:MAG: PAS domain-containing protein, partial [Acidobacteria bacterium]|nr:PAS domain-containing protein [Acidobacteriota bacterium]